IQGTELSPGEQGLAGVQAALPVAGILGKGAKAASGTTGRGPVGIMSRIKESRRLVREASKAGESVQPSLDRLVEQLANGNLYPGIGTKSIGKGILEARARDGARVYFRDLDGVVEILGKSTKANQSAVIQEVVRVFGQ